MLASFPRPTSRSQSAPGAAVQTERTPRGGFHPGGRNHRPNGAGGAGSHLPHPTRDRQASLAGGGAIALLAGTARFRGSWCGVSGVLASFPRPTSRSQSAPGAAVQTERTPRGGSPPRRTKPQAERCGRSRAAPAASNPGPPGKPSGRGCHCVACGHRSLQGTSVGVWGRGSRVLVRLTCVFSVQGWPFTSEKNKAPKFLGSTYAPQWL